MFLKNISQLCTDGLSSSSQDRKNYGFGWSLFNQTYSPPNGFQSMYAAFQYQNEDQLQGSPYTGQFKTYDGGGYLFELRGKLSYLQGNLSLLREMNWIDRQTRAIFFEFSVYNPNINLVMISTILVEFLESGSILTSARFDPLNLFSESGGCVISFKILSEIIFMAFVVFFMLIEIKNVFKRNLKEYFSEFWSYIDWSIIITAWISFTMFLVRLSYANQVLEFFKQTAGYGYMKLQKANNSNQTLTFSLGLCAFFGTLKILKMLRFNRSISHLSQTLSVCFVELTSFGILVFFILYISFVQLMYLIFNKTMEGFSSLTHAMATAFEIMIGKSSAEDFITDSPILGPLIYSAYNIVIIFFALNIFISIITNAFSSVRLEAKTNPHEFDFYEHVRFKLKRLFRKKSPLDDLLPPSKYRDHLSILPSRIDGIVNIIIRVNRN